MAARRLAFVEVALWIETNEKLMSTPNAFGNGGALKLETCALPSHVSLRSHPDCDRRSDRILACLLSARSDCLALVFETGTG